MGNLNLMVVPTNNNRTTSHKRKSKSLKITTTTITKARRIKTVIQTIKRRISRRNEGTTKQQQTMILPSS